MLKVYKHIQYFYLNKIKRTKINQDNMRDKIEQSAKKSGRKPREKN